MSLHPFFSAFDDPGSWQVFASGQAQGKLSRSTADDGTQGLRLDYDFHGGGGFVVMRMELPFTLPETFEIGFLMRGAGPPNHFEFKVADPGGTNVWRYLRQNFALPEAWTDCRFHERDLLFAWGPAGGGAPSQIGAVEFVIAAGPGGKGSLELVRPSIEDQTLRAPAEVRASSQQPGFAPGAVFETDARKGWRAAADDLKPTWQVDFGRLLRFGGLVIGWPESLPPRCYVMETSNDGAAWTQVHQATSALGRDSHIALPGAEARHLRITFGNPGCAALRSLSLRPDSFSHTPNEFIHNVAADYPRGWFPRYWAREQSYWTPVGSPEGKRRALINEEGIVEVDEAEFSLEPFVLIDGNLVTWADVKNTRSLPAGGAPMPSVTWKTADMTLEIQPWVDGKDDNLTLHINYRLRCGNAPAGVRMFVAVRPFQMNPPWQAFRNLGGHSPIHHIECRESGMLVDLREVSASPKPCACGAATFEEGGVVAFLAQGILPPGDRIVDVSGLGSGAMGWDLPAGKTTMLATVSVPYFGKINPPSKDARARAHARWRKTLGKVEWSVPDCARSAFDCFRTAAGHILINRDGPAIQPGPRRYTRSWIRDCVIMGAALAKAGLPKPLRIFLTWYAPFQRADGFVPCVVDRDGIDWLVEHDSHGQLLWGIREVFRDGGDQELVNNLLPHVCKAADYLMALRAQRMTEEYKAGVHSESFGLLPESISMDDEDTVGGHAACYGLLPESASHEGYLAHPVHSYWDDFWGVRGLEAAADLAQAMGLTDDAARWRKEAALFQADLLRSLDRVIAGHKLSYIPGSVEWADFDPTATSNAVAMLDFADVLPQKELHAMLETYLDGFRRKHRGEMHWNNYTAYEIRIIGAFVRLGKRDVANELLEFFLSDRRPLEWNQWPEITWRDPLSPGHIGDVPHTWIAAEYMLALASMVACEREASDSIVLASGMPWKWIAGDKGFTVRNLPVRHGSLDFTIKAGGNDSIHVEVGGVLTLPPGGLSIAPPLPEGMRIVSAVSSTGNPPAITPGGTSISVEQLPFKAALQLHSLLTIT